MTKQEKEKRRKCKKCGHTTFSVRSNKTMQFLICGATSDIDNPKDLIIICASCRHEEPFLREKLKKN